MRDVDLMSFNFGPLLTLCNIEESTRQELLDVGLNNNIDWRSKLAGQIDNEKSYSPENINYFGRKLRPYFDAYFHRLVNRPPNVNLSIRPYVYKLDSLWINVQRELEYNPIHHHSGDISFVIYLEISEEIYSEVNTTTSIRNGAIQFVDGFDHNYFKELNDDWENIRRTLVPLRAYQHMPRAGEMFIFPSYLTHHVQAFKTPGCRRISISGNVSIGDVITEEESLNSKTGNYIWQDVVS